MAIPNLALVVDDEAHVQTYVSLILRELGVGHTLAAGDAETGFSLYQQNQPGVIILDLHLPGGASGLDLLKRIRAVDEDVPVIFLSCEAAAATVMAAANAGADGYVRKDTPKQEILRQIQEFLADPDDEGSE
ncbi:MAG: response regulator [Bryobacterales bacterium]|nr:response regulator [Opitutaceae bacterium]MCZ2153043.1 response regulator [Bryobacterales bacterium]